MDLAVRDGAFYPGIEPGAIDGILDVNGLPVISIDDVHLGMNGSGPAVRVETVSATVVGHQFALGLIFDECGPDCRVAELGHHVTLGKPVGIEVDNSTEANRTFGIVIGTEG